MLSVAQAFLVCHQWRYLDAIIHVLSIEIQVARSLPHVCLGYMGCVQQLVAILEVMLLHTRQARD